MSFNIVRLTDYKIIISLTQLSHIKNTLKTLKFEYIFKIQYHT